MAARRDDMGTYLWSLHPPGGHYRYFMRFSWRLTLEYGNDDDLLFDCYEIPEIWWTETYIVSQNYPEYYPCPESLKRETPTCPSQSSHPAPKSESGS